MAHQANGTPESEFSIECFQNYSAPEVFIQGLAGIVNQTDVETMIRAQKQMLQRFEKTNEMLTNCNALSASRLKVAGAEFKKHTQLLLDMKKDLDYIFKKIRALKAKLSTQYPEAFEIAQKAALLKASQEDEEEEMEHNPKPTTSLTKDISKSTETLRPSISQVFSKSPNETDGNAIKEIDEKSTEITDKQDRLSGEKDSAEGGVSSHPKMKDLESRKKKDVRPRKKSTEKLDRNSSSSSDNSNSSSTSGDCTSDTG